MVAVTDGRQRTLTDYEALLDAAGIDLVATTSTTTSFSVIEGQVHNPPPRPHPTALTNLGLGRAVTHSPGCG